MEREPSVPSPVLVTGGTGGIGRVTARALVRDGWPVVLWVRDGPRGQALRTELLQEVPSARIDVAEGDLGLLASVRTTTGRIVSEHPRLSAIAHAAARLTRRREETPEGIETMFATNYLGPFLLTRLLTERLDPTRPFRVVVLSPPSTAPLDLADLESHRKFRSLTAFATSKTATLLFAYALARRFSGRPWTSNVFFPGVVRSSLLREAPWMVRAFARAIGSGAEGAGESLAWLLTGAPLASVTGQFFEGTRIGTTSDYSRDVGLQDRLWARTEELIAAVEEPDATAPGRRTGSGGVSPRGVR